MSSHSMLIADERLLVNRLSRKREGGEEGRKRERKREEEREKMEVEREGKRR